MSFYRILPLNQDKQVQAYVIGLAIGDGNLSNPNGRATRLRITCDDKYPTLRAKIIKSLQLLLPTNKVGTILRKNMGCTDVYIYSNHLEKMLGWKADGGSKLIQQVCTPAWIIQSKNYKIDYLRGLIETDGSIYNDRGYKMVIFSTVIEKLASEVYNIIQSLGFSPKTYTVKQKTTGRLKYQIRLSKNVQKFLDIVKPDKS